MTQATTQASTGATPHPYFAQHSETLDRARQAIADRTYWSAYPESPSPKVYGETAAADGEKAFKAYQQLVEKYPKSANYNEVVERQYVIANRYLAGQ